MPPARIKTSSNLTLNDEVKELEKVFLDKIGRLNARVQENEDWVAGEAKHAEDLIDSLRLNIAELETKLAQIEDTSRKKDLFRREKEEGLTAKINDLQNDLKAKEEALQNRGSEVNELKSKIDRQVKQVADLQAAIETAKADAATQAKRAEDLAASLPAKVAGLEAQLRDTNDVLRTKELTIKRLEENLGAKVQDLESQLRTREELLTGRDTEITTLKSQLRVLTKGLEEMAFFFKKAEALAAIDGQSSRTPSLNEPMKAREEKAADSENAKVTPSAPDAAPDIVSDYAFGDMIRELAELTNVIGIVASMIVREHVTALGESMETFPKARLPQLVESLSREILDESRKARFCDRVGKL
jgi:chromosome segregation ATPase